MRLVGTMRYVTFLLATVVAWCFPSTAVQADLFKAQGDVNAFLETWSDSKQQVNSVDRTGVTVELAHSDSLGSVTAFSAVLPRPLDAPLTSPYIQFEAEARVSMNGVGPGGSADAKAIGQWQDVVHFTPKAVRRRRFPPGESSCT
jgi:hypothetical protein